MGEGLVKPLDLVEHRLDFRHAALVSILFLFVVQCTNYPPTWRLPFCLIVTIRIWEADLGCGSILHTEGEGGF